MGLVFRMYQDTFLDSLVGLWNDSAREWHGFFPLTPELMQRHIINSLRFRAENFLLAEYNGRHVGWVHFDVVDQPPYEKAGVINALLVHPDYRCQGIGSKLMQEALFRLQRRGVNLYDALGAWPYSSFYAGLIDGSERAGVDERDRAMLWLMDKFEFIRQRQSYVMRAHCCEFSHQIGDNEQTYYQSRAGKQTWLDHAFRSWELFDHVLLSDSGRVLSRAIHARMDGLSEYTGREMHAIFGVHTPESARGRGMATRNLQLLLSRLNIAGVQEAELHVYTDNQPALRLYNKLGFARTGTCVCMRRR